MIFILALALPTLTSIMVLTLAGPQLHAQVSKSESYTIELDPVKATQGRDAFAKAIYQRIFDHLVARVNGSLKIGDSPTLHAKVMGRCSALSLALFRHGRSWTQFHRVARRLRLRDF